MQYQMHHNQNTLSTRMHRISAVVSEPLMCCSTSYRGNLSIIYKYSTTSTCANKSSDRTRWEHENEIQLPITKMFT